MHEVVWLPQAEINLNDQLDYIEMRNPRAALAIADQILMAARQLATYPLSGRQGRKNGTRELVISGTPYVMIYRVDGACVIVLRLLHGARSGGRRTAERGVLKLRSSLAPLTRRTIWRPV